MKYVGEVIDRKCGDYEPLGMSLVPLNSEHDDIELNKHHCEDYPYQQIRIYSDEVPMASSKTLLNIRGKIVDSLCIIRKNK